MQEKRKPLDWMGRSKDDLLSMPVEVCRHIGFALDVAQTGDVHDSASPLKGMGNTRVVEIRKNNDGNTYRCVYTTLFPDLICVLHCFQKKGSIGKKVSKNDVAIIDARLKSAKDKYF